MAGRGGAARDGAARQAGERRAAAREAAAREKECAGTRGGWALRDAVGGACVRSVAAFSHTRARPRVAATSSGLATTRGAASGAGAHRGGATAERVVGARPLWSGVGRDRALATRTHDNFPIKKIHATTIFPSSIYNLSRIDRSNTIFTKMCIMCVCFCQTAAHVTDCH